MSAKLLGCDWGTSSFRLMVLGADGKILQQQSSQQGIASLAPAQQVHYLQAQITLLDESYRDLPLLLCGMAGSSIGLHNTGYLDCPSNRLRLAQALVPLDDNTLFARLVPGVRYITADGHWDVMRGEETQVLGWLAETGWQGQAQLCLPGTHSKWVNVDQGQITRLRTALTGELFATLKQHSILVQGEQTTSETWFLNGVERSLENPNIGHTLFSTRSLTLAQKMKPDTAASYLSGLLIGAEIQPLLDKIQTTHLIGAPSLTHWYAEALAFAGVRTERWLGDQLVAKGLVSLYQAGASLE